MDNINKKLTKINTVAAVGAVVVYGSPMLAIDNLAPPEVAVSTAIGTAVIVGEKIRRIARS